MRFSRAALLSACEITGFLFLVPLWAVSVQAQPFRRFLLFAGCAYALWRLRGRVSWKTLLGRPQPGWWTGPLARGAVVWLLLCLWVACTDPGALFSLPRERPGLWLAILGLYPPLSVLPQEIIYRVYLVEAHPLLRRRALPAILVSALLFGWVHVIYAGWFALAASTAAGLLLARTYWEWRGARGALWPVLLEHSLFGLGVFTLGLGRYFYLAR